MANASLKNNSRIPEGDIEEIRARADILEVASEFVELKQAGKNYKGLCPFHSEKTPSFNVSQEKQFYHCFGCGKGGSVFNFLMEIESISFIDAVRKLASRYHVPLPERALSPREEQNRSERESLLKLNELASGYFARLLNADNEGKSPHLLPGLEDQCCIFPTLLASEYSPAAGIAELSTVAPTFRPPRGARTPGR